MSSQSSKFIRFAMTGLLGMAGFAHLSTPEFFLPFIPPWLPFEWFVIYASGVLELALALMLFIPRTEKWAAAGIFAMLLIYLPLHIWDLFREQPAIGSFGMAIVRVPIQFILLGLSWKLFKSSQNQ
jgi:uncharacterized membrane protein